MVEDALETVDLHGCVPGELVQAPVDFDGGGGALNRVVAHQTVRGKSLAGEGLGGQCLGCRGEPDERWDNRLRQLGSNHREVDLWVG